MDNNRHSMLQDQPGSGNLYRYRRMVIQVFWTMFRSARLPELAQLVSSLSMGAQLRARALGNLGEIKRSRLRSFAFWDPEIAAGGK
jgi:hypothetical protein